MITEDYCSYEVAKLLKEKGFNEPCDNYYDKKGSEKQEPQELTWDEMYYSYDKFLKAPTHQMAMKWLREVHNISVEPFSDWVFSDVGWICLWSVDIAKIVRDGLITELTRKSYEEAVEAALKYSLENLI